MSDNRKYYYLKLKENYFDEDAIVLLESMQDGILYSNILLKLYLKSLKNGTLRPNNVTAGSNRRVWWRCEKGHSYRAVIAQRVQRGDGCPYCANRKVLPGFNDLATAAPLVAKQWHETLNGALTPEMVTAGSHKKAWWQCSYGHVWKAAIYSRAGVQQCGCPVCAGKTRRKTK